jgi:hypothetical protein
MIFFEDAIRLFEGSTSDIAKWIEPKPADEAEEMQIFAATFLFEITTALSRDHLFFLNATKDMYAALGLSPQKRYNAFVSIRTAVMEEKSQALARAKSLKTIWKVKLISATRLPGIVAVYLESLRGERNSRMARTALALKS